MRRPAAAIPHKPELVYRTGMCLSVYLGTSRPITAPQALPGHLGVEKASWTPPPLRSNHQFVYYLGRQGRTLSWNVHACSWSMLIGALRAPGSFRTSLLPMSRHARSMRFGRFATRRHRTAASQRSLATTAEAWSRSAPWMTIAPGAWCVSTRSCEAICFSPTRAGGSLGGSSTWSGSKARQRRSDGGAG